MKKIVAFLMVMTLLICSVLSVSADGTTVGNIYQIDGVTVVFDADSQLSAEQQEQIAELLVHPEYGVSQVNLICNIFGHKNTSEPVVTITHCAKATSPRCLQEVFTVTTCSRCNESTVERNAMSYITCCPED